MPDVGTRKGDQAKDLRRIVDMQRRPAGRLTGLRSLAVLSGKGGVGKSNISVNLSLAMAGRGKRVVLLDADLGMANVDLLCGLSPRFNLAHVIRGQKQVRDILLPLGENLSVLPGGPGVRELADLDEEALLNLIDSMSILEGLADVLVIDTGAGIHRNTISFGAASDAVLLVTTPEPTSIRDAYGVLKALVSATAGKTEVTVVVNMAASPEEGEDVADRIRSAASQFLGISPAFGGTVLRDETVPLSVKRRTPLLSAYPDSDASRCIRAVAGKILGLGGEQEHLPPGKGVKSFFFRLARGLGLGQ